MKPIKRIMKEVKCQVCRSPVMVDEQYNADETCWICGWIQTGSSRKSPWSWSISNILSLDKARQLYKQGKPIRPDFDDFLYFYKHYGEVEFRHNNIFYGVVRASNGIGVVFWPYNVIENEEMTVQFDSIEDFKANAKISGVLVKDLWDEVDEYGPM